MRAQFKVPAFRFLRRCEGVFYLLGGRQDSRVVLPHHFLTLNADRGDLENAHRDVTLIAFDDTLNKPEAIRDGRDGDC